MLDSFVGMPVLHRLMRPSWHRCSSSVHAKSSLHLFYAISQANRFLLSGIKYQGQTWETLWRMLIMTFKGFRNFRRTFGWQVQHLTSSLLFFKGGLTLKGPYTQVMVSSKVWHALRLTRAASRRADSAFTIAFMQVLFECFWVVAVCVSFIVLCVVLLLLFCLVASLLLFLAWLIFYWARPL